MQIIDWIQIPLDLTVNRSIKLIERREYTQYFTDIVSISWELTKDPQIDVSDIEIDIREVMVRPLQFTFIIRPLHS